MASSGPLRLGQADYLENNGIYRGFAWYEAVSDITAEQSSAARGILVGQGSDVVSVYAGSELRGDYSSRRRYPVLAIAFGNIQG